MSKNNDKNNDENKAEIKKKENKIWKIIIYGLTLVIIAFIWLWCSASITFLIIDNIHKNKLNEILPSCCSEYPYGSKDVCPCEKNSSKITNLIKSLPTVMKSVVNGESMLFDEETWFIRLAGSEKQKTRGGNDDNKKSKPVNKMDLPLPYRLYKKDETNDFGKYVNWLLTSLIITKININSYTKEFLEFIKKKEINSSILVIFSLSVMLLFSFLISFYSFFSLFSSQVLSIANYGLITGILIFISLWAMFFIDMGISSFYSIKLMYDICIKPLLNSTWRLEIKNILLENKTIIGFIFGFIFIRILNSIDMNKDYEKPVKLIPTTIFYLALIIHFINYYKNKHK
jgi:hypothetical protein